MQLSIAYDYGPISDMAWCPKGCWEDPSTECVDNTLPRLGMLAVACSDGNVRVYSIPHPGLLMNESVFPIYESCPAVILQPLFGESCSVTRKSLCTCVSWQKSDNCERVASGYGNGKNVNFVHNYFKNLVWTSHDFFVWLMNYISFLI